MSPSISAQRAFQLAREGCYKQAQQIFTDLKFEPENPVETSFVALTDAVTKQNYKSATEKCLKALDEWPKNPEIYYNLTQILLFAGRKDLAIIKLLKGLTLNPEHHGLRILHKRLGIRRSPVIQSLPRTNPINVIAGKILR